MLKSETMRKLYRLAERAAAGRTASGLINVLILGETGAGKEVLAELDPPALAAREPGRCVCINCAAHLRDRCWRASCSATRRARSRARRRPSRGCSRPPPAARCSSTRSASMPPALQTKLLRALENREVTRVGGLRGARDRRALHGRHQPRSRGGGREQDASARISTSASTASRSTIPPLRERPDEIEPLARRFLAEAARAAQAPPARGCRPRRSSCSAATPGRQHPRAAQRRSSGRWCCARTARSRPSTSRSTSCGFRAWRRTAGSPAPTRRPPRRAAPPLTPTEAAERQRILELLAAYGGNQTRVAKKLGIARGTLIERLKRYGIKRPQVGD